MPYKSPFELKYKIGSSFQSLEREELVQALICSEYPIGEDYFRFFYAKTDVLHLGNLDYVNKIVDGFYDDPYALVPIPTSLLYIGEFV